MFYIMISLNITSQIVDIKNIYLYIFYSDTLPKTGHIQIYHKVSAMCYR